MAGTTAYSAQSFQTEFISGPKLARAESYSHRQDRRSPEKVILMNIRGASKSHIDALIRTSALGDNSAFRFLSNSADKAIQVEPIPNAVTAVNNAALETGVYPDRNGIIGNSFGRPGGKIFEQLSGFNTPFLSEAVWEKVARSGKKVIRLGTLQINGLRRNEFTVPTLPQVSPLSESQILKLSNSPNCNYQIEKKDIENLRCLSDSESSPRVRLSFGALHKELVIVAVDLIKDGRPGFHRLIVDDDYVEKNGVMAEITEGEWFGVLIKSTRPASVGSYAKLLKLSPDLDTVTLYVGPAFQNDGYPDPFISNIEDQVGFAVGGPDYQGFLQGRMDRETLLEQAHRETDYMQRIALVCLKHFDFDLLLYDHPILDRYGHYSYSKANHRENLPAMQAGYVATDRNIRSLLDAIDPNDISLIVISGHGFNAVHTSISIKKLFEALDIRISPTPNADVSVISSKISAHIYFNKGRFSKRQEYEKTLRSLKDRLQSYRDPNLGELIFDRIVTKAEMKQVHLNNKQRGSDLWVCLKPGYTFDGLIEQNELIGRPFFSGEHGYFDSSQEAKGVLYYLGSKKIKLKDDLINTTMVAPIVYQLMDIPN